MKEKMTVSRKKRMARADGRFRSQAGCGYSVLTYLAFHHADQKDDVELEALGAVKRHELQEN